MDLIGVMAYKHESVIQFAVSACQPERDNRCFVFISRKTSTVEQKRSSYNERHIERHFAKYIHWLPATLTMSIIDISSINRHHSYAIKIGKWFVRCYLTIHRHWHCITNVEERRQDYKRAMFVDDRVFVFPFPGRYERQVLLN
ncbi:unnamed protein product, partial [Iphiclides podalirius]